MVFVLVSQIPYIRVLKEKAEFSKKIADRVHVKSRAVAGRLPNARKTVRVRSASVSCNLFSALICVCLMNGDPYSSFQAEFNEAFCQNELC